MRTDRFSFPFYLASTRDASLRAGMVKFTRALVIEGLARDIGC